MRVCHVTTYAQGFLDRFYRATPELASAPYAEQHQRLMAQRFGWSDFIVEYSRDRGGDAVAIVANDERARAQWAREHDLPSDSREAVLAHQIASFRPDVLFLEDSFSIPATVLRAARRDTPSLRCALGYVGVVNRVPPLAKDLDLIVTSAPALEPAFVEAGIRTMTMLHGFEGHVLEEVPAPSERLPVTFVGSVAAGIHEDRRQVLEAVAARAPLAVFSDSLRPGLKAAVRSAAVATVRRRLPAYARLMTSSLRRQARPAVYGLDMYAALQASDVSINFQGWGVPYLVPNMRLFETTGMGACMVTDAKPGLEDFFEADGEVVTYRSPDECAEKVRWLLDHPEQRAAIGRAGQLRTLKQHAFRDRVNGLLARIQAQL